jgi:hypothetical protein
VSCFPTSFRFAACVVVSAVIFGVASAARAQEVHGDAHEVGRAEALFAAGKQRLAANDYVAACSLFAQSYLLDPATGSLLALALCHERQGKLASALREYREAVARSRQEQRGDREQAALAQIEGLKPRLSTLTLHPEEPGLPLVVRVNGELLPSEQLGRPQPMDGGFVLVEAEAEGKITWRTGVTIAESGQALSVAIPLMRTGTASPPPTPSAEAAPRVVPETVPVPVTRPVERPTAGKKLSTLERTGIALLVSGAVSAGLAIAFTLRAVSKDKDSDAGCYDDLCTKQARRDRLDARSAGNIATIATAGAAALASGGLISFLVGARRRRDERQRATGLRASAWIDPHSAGAAVSGGF